MNERDVDERDVEEQDARHVERNGNRRRSELILVKILARAISAKRPHSLHLSLCIRRPVLVRVIALNLRVFLSNPPSQLIALRDFVSMPPRLQHRVDYGFEHPLDYVAPLNSGLELV